MFNAAERNSQSVVIIMLRTCPSERAPRAPCPGLSPATQVGWGRGVRALRGSRAPSAAGAASCTAAPPPPLLLALLPQATEGHLATFSAPSQPAGLIFRKPPRLCQPGGGHRGPQRPLPSLGTAEGTDNKGLLSLGRNRTRPGPAAQPAPLRRKADPPRKAPTDRRRAPRLPRRPLQPLGSMAGPWGLARGPWRQCPLARPPHTTAAGLSGVRPDSWCVPR